MQGMAGSGCFNTLLEGKAPLLICRLCMNMERILYCRNLCFVWLCR